MGLSLIVSIFVRSMVIDTVEDVRNSARQFRGPTVHHAVFRDTEKHRVWFDICYDNWIRVSVDWPGRVACHDEEYELTDAPSRTLLSQIP